MDAKEYYRTGRHSEWSPSPMRRDLLKRVMSHNPHNVLEFGCGRGENLRILKDMCIRTEGIDINGEEAIKAKLNADTVHIGDETLLSKLTKEFDVSFTCGVLDHIPEIGELIMDLETITKKHIYALETNDQPTDYYYPHDYSALGFYKIEEYPPAFPSLAIYTLWGRKC